MFQRLANALGLPLTTTLLVCWGVSAVVIVVALVVLLVGGSQVVGIVLFLLGAIASFAVTTAMLRVRSNIPPKNQR